MRWPLKNQILLRMLLLLLISILAVTFANIRSTMAFNRTAEQNRLEKIVELIQSTRFPLSQTVLENMSLLSGAEFVLQHQDGDATARTQGSPSVNFDQRSNDNATSGMVVSGGDDYYHEIVPTSANRNQNLTDDRLHVFLPRQSDSEIWWRASRVPLGIAFLALPIAFAISWAMANQVTRPLARLENQVRQIAAGDLQQIPSVGGNDEITQLGNSINELAIQLEDHDEQLRRNERLKNMVQFGNSIAHHLRNMSSGCRMAIELMADKHSTISKSENFVVASRQLELMDVYIRKFLLLSKSPDQVSAAEPLMLNDLLDSTLFLLQPNAEHLDVTLQVDCDSDGTTVDMSREYAEQLMMNLIGNGIAAASRANSTTDQNARGQVDVRLKIRDGQFSFSVIDNGSGPPEELADSLFQPFVSGKSEGTGLGLAVVRDIADRIGGSIHWQRHDGKTEFVFDSQAGHC